MKDYKYMNKESKTKVKEEFLEKGDTTVYNKANRIIILCIIGVVLSIGSLVFDFTFHAETISYVLDGLLFIFSILVFFRVKSIQRKEINNYLNKSKK